MKNCWAKPWISTEFHLEGIPSACHVNQGISPWQTDLAFRCAWSFFVLSTVANFVPQKCREAVKHTCFFKRNSGTARSRIHPVLSFFFLKCVCCGHVFVNFVSISWNQCDLDDSFIMTAFTEVLGGWKLVRSCYLSLTRCSSLRSARHRPGAKKIILHMMILREKALQVTKILKFAKRFLFFGILKWGWFLRFEVWFRSWCVDVWRLQVVFQLMKKMDEQGSFRIGVIARQEKLVV